jgi:hypothetical protein
MGKTNRLLSFHTYEGGHAENDATNTLSLSQDYFYGNVAKQRLGDTQTHLVWYYIDGKQTEAY